jgi:hypothetical protein
MFTRIKLVAYKRSKLQNRRSRKLYSKGIGGFMRKIKEIKKSKEKPFE